MLASYGSTGYLDSAAVQPHGGESLHQRLHPDGADGVESQLQHAQRRGSTSGATDRVADRFETVGQRHGAGVAEARVREVQAAQRRGAPSHGEVLCNMLWRLGTSGGVAAVSDEALAQEKEFATGSEEPHGTAQGGRSGPTVSSKKGKGENRSTLCFI